MNKQEILDELKGMKNRIEVLINRLCEEKQETKETRETNDLKDNKANEDMLVCETVKNYALKNNMVLDEMAQKELFSKIAPFNFRKLSLIKLFRLLGIEFSYIPSDKSWKDIRINNIETMLYVNDLNNN